MLSLRRAGRLPARRPRVRQVSPYWTIPSAGEALDRWLLHPVRYLLWFLQADDLHGTVSARVPGGADAALVGPGARRRARGGVAGGHRPLHTVRPRPEPLGTRGIAPGGRFGHPCPLDGSGRAQTASACLCEGPHGKPALAVCKNWLIIPAGAHRPPAARPADRARLCRAGAGTIKRTSKSTYVSLVVRPGVRHAGAPPLARTRAAGRKSRGGSCGAGGRKRAPTRGSPGTSHKCGGCRLPGLPREPSPET